MAAFNADYGIHSPENAFTQMKYDSKRFREDKVAVRTNYNIREAYARWIKLFPKDLRIPGTESRGCGINALVFLSEMSVSHAKDNVIDQGYVGNTGTPIEEMVEWLNQKMQKVSPKKRLLFYEFRYGIVSRAEVPHLNEPGIKQSIKNQMSFFFKMIFDDLELNSTTLIKYERDPVELVVKRISLTPGHTAVIGKCLDENNVPSLYVADPQGLQAPRKINFENISDGMFNSLIVHNHYRGISIVRAANVDCAFLVNMIHYMLPRNRETNLLHTAATYLESNRADLMATPTGNIDDKTESRSVSINTPKSKSKSKSSISRKSKIFGGSLSRRKAKTVVDITSMLEGIPTKDPIVCDVSSSNKKHK